MNKERDRIRGMLGYARKCKRQRTGKILEKHWQPPVRKRK